MRKFFRDNKGIAAMEYAILAAAILGVVGVAAVAMSADLSALFVKVETALVAAGG